ncbi:MAG: hypothetical protein OQK78_07020 [Gammaproteobacteria bacterium]|nr:hypothetical protein [Gammaproteobacteria bacterium]MCW8887956.1 hypothetical protein [Gammaproteobacteria bacterium]
MIAAIDGDYIPYLCAGSSKVEERFYNVAEGPDSAPLFSCKYKKDAVQYCKKQGLPLEFVHHTRQVIDEREMYYLLDAEFEDIFRNTGADKYHLYLGGKTNYRYDLFPDYKSHRKNYSRPVLLAQAKQYLIDKYNAEVVEGIEADDAVSILCSNEPNSILCSPDKDLDQVPCMHYDPNKGEVYVIDEEIADACLYVQILTGDSTDSIPGVKGIGPKKAEKLLRGITDRKEMWDICVKAHGSEESANLTASLVYVLRNHGEFWTPPC